MPDGVTARHFLPNLYVGQSQKEITHNEALLRIDALLHPVIEDRLSAPPAPLDMTHDGKCWLVGAAATGLWTGKTSQIARWSAGSWRFLEPVAGMSIWMTAESQRLFYIAGSWLEPAAITEPAGGAVIDTEARATITAIVTHLRAISNIPL